MMDQYDPASVRTVGSNQLGMREFNERVVLQAIRLHGSLPKAELARLTRLSTQTVAVIINRLLADGLVVKRDSLRGKVGQPSQPIALNPDGAFSIGIQVGRRELELMMIDFTGTPRFRSTATYAAPDVENVFSEIERRLREALEFLPPALVDRLSGIGIAAPLMFGGWQQLLGMSPSDANAWTRTNIRERMQAMTSLPVEFAKDTAAACVAELVAGRGRHVKSYLYIYIDTLVGGGLVINGQPHSGRYGNAGAVGSMPLAAADGEHQKPTQMLSVASLVALEEMYAEAGRDATASHDERAMQGPWLAVTQRWLAAAAPAIAFSITNSACLLDLDGVIIDGAIHRTLLDRLLDEVKASLNQYNWQGLLRPELYGGAVGADAKVRGASYLPLHTHFAPAHDLFLKLERQGQDSPIK